MVETMSQFRRPYVALLSSIATVCAVIFALLFAAGVSVLGAAAVVLFWAIVALSPAFLYNGHNGLAASMLVGAVFSATTIALLCYYDFGTSYLWFSTVAIVFWGAVGGVFAAVICTLTWGVFCLLERFGSACRTEMDRFFFIEPSLPRRMNVLSLLYITLVIGCSFMLTSVNVSTRYQMLPAEATAVRRYRQPFEAGDTVEFDVDEDAFMRWAAVNDWALHPIEGATRFDWHQDATPGELRIVDGYWLITSDEVNDYTIAYDRINGRGYYRRQPLR